MNNINSILIQGNLTADPESRTTSSGQLVTTFSIACNRSYKVQDTFKTEVSYFQVTSWGKLAESCSGKLFKGKGIRVLGRLKQDRWIDREGKSHSKVHIIADSIHFIEQMTSVAAAQ